ncbi:uncharacterized protein PG998_006785 [Apiospora kogelbergensis]|uniref:uncharacterized protein n=1 Tax=Apiospora kogelbergensis TaxID=1337665 RepID=UPI0031302CE9
MTALTVISMALRFWSRSLGQASTPGWDDWAALVAVPFILAMHCISFRMVDLGWGRHIRTVDPDDSSMSLKLLFIVYLVNDFALFFSKASGLLFISRIFPSFANPAWFNYMVVVTHGLNIAWLIGIVFGTVFICTPVEKAWNSTMSGHCGASSDLWIGCAIPSVTIDLFILALPMPKVWGLHMTKGRRWGLFVVFVLGYSVIIVSLGRLITILVMGTDPNQDITCKQRHNMQ